MGWRKNDPNLTNDPTYLEPRINNLDAEINQINENLSEQEQQTQTLQHGLNVLSSDQASPLKVEFYGNTLVNHTTANELLWINGYYSSSGTIGSSQTAIAFNKKLKFNTGDYLIFNVNDGYTLTIRSYDENNSLVDNQTSANLIKLEITTGINVGVQINKEDGSNFTVSEVVSAQPKTYKIDQSTYDKIGVSLTDADVERMFPYVDSVQHVRNPYVKVSGANLLPPFYEWNLHANTTVVSSYELRLDATDSFQQSFIKYKVSPNTTYSVSVNAEQNSRMYLQERDADDNNLGITGGSEINMFTRTFTTSANCSYIQVILDNYATTGTFTFSQPMLTLGSEPRPFVPKNDSYLYAYKVNEETGENEPLILAGNDDKKDISYYNEGNGRWEKRGWFEIDKVLDGSLGYLYHADMVEYKSVKLPISTPIHPYAYCKGTKHDGNILVDSYTYDSYTNNEDAVRVLDGHIWITIPDIDSGWTDAMIPSADLIKSYFYGWKYTGDGTTHSWEAITDPSVTSTDIAHVSTTKATEEYTPYKLTYQLAEPTVEEVRVEGDLSIQGDAQVEVGEGVVVREKVTPIIVGSSYRINDTLYAPESKVNNKLEKFLKIFKNGKDDTHNWEIRNEPNNSYGNQRALIVEDKFDPNATYTVTYEILDKHDFTTNLNEVVAHYQNSIKSSIQGVVSKQSDIATDVSVLDGTVYDMLLRLKKLEQEGAV
jgi:hypothetical protein